MKKITIMPLLAALLLTTACTKVIEFDGDETESQPVLISHAEADSLMTLRLSYSRFFLSAKPYQAIGNAVIHADLNGTASTSQFSYQDNGIYRSNFPLHENDTITLHISIPDKGEITAGCRVPLRPVVDDITVTPDITVDTYYYDYTQNTFNASAWGDINFTFRLHDPATPGDCYMVRAYSIDSATGERHEQYIYLNDNILYDEDVANDYLDIGSGIDYSSGRQAYFTDERINGTAHTVQGHINVNFHYTSTLYIDVCAISRDDYLFFITLHSQQNSDDVLGFVSEPVQIHSNVEGGIGILGAMSPRHIELYKLTLSNGTQPTDKK